MHSKLQIINQATMFFSYFWRVQICSVNISIVCMRKRERSLFICHPAKKKQTNRAGIAIYESSTLFVDWVLIKSSSVIVSYRFSSTETGKNGITFHRETQLLCVLNNFSGRSSFFLLVGWHFFEWGAESSQSQVSVRRLCMFMTYESLKYSVQRHK